MKKFSDYVSEETKSDLEGAIKKLFTEKSPSDDDVHDLAESMGVDAHKFEEVIYSMLHNLLK